MRKWFGSILSILIFYSLSASDIQTNYAFSHLSIDERLPGANVYSIFQDQKGIMWFGIESVGLCRYNGKSFQVYSRTPGDTISISDNIPLCIAEDTAGLLWIGTTYGLNKFDRQKGVFKRYYFSEGLSNSIPGNYITDLHIDRLNNLWIATRTGVSKYIKVHDRFYNILIGEGTYTDGLPAMVSTFYEDKEGNIWIGSYSSGLFLVDSATNLNHNKGEKRLEVTKHWFPKLNEKGHEDNYAVQQICEFDDYSLLLGKIDGLYLFNHETETFVKFNNHANPSVNYDAISALIKDQSGRIWVGYATKGLLFIDPKNNEQHFFNADIYIPKGIRSNTIRDLYEDKSGLIWIATKFQGIHTYNKKQELLVKHKYNELLDNKLGKKFILSVFEDSDNFIWIGTKYSGIFKVNPVSGVVVNYTSDNMHGRYYINSNRVECITEDAFGNIWAGTKNGSQKLEPNGMSFRSYDDYFIRSIVADKDGNLWMGTNSSGVIYYKAGSNETSRFVSLKESRFFNDNTIGIIALNITSDSLLWVSTFQNGLYKYNLKSDKLTHYLTDINDTTSISGNLVRTVYEDRSSNIWVCTESKGLNRYNYNNDNFLLIKQINGLPPNTIYNILQDRHENYWMGSHEGLFMINHNTGEYSLFNATYGLKSLVTEINACCFTHNDLMIFGGSEGLNVFNPNEVIKINNNLNLVITSLKIYNRTIAEEINEYAEFPINYKDKFITIEFALTEYADPLKVKYEYMLENFDNDWILSGNTNIATYTDLPPGKYIFKVKAANAENVWINEPLSIMLKIKGPFWLNPIFIVISVILIIVLAVTIHLSRLRFLRKNEIKLNELVKVKTRDLMELNQELEENRAMLEEALEKAEESDKLKTTFLANLSHEIRTPMNGILGFAELLKEENLRTDQFQNYIKVIQKSGTRLLAIINDLVDISKIEAGQIRINIERVLINDIIDELYAFFKPVVESKGLRLISEKALPLKESAIMVDKTRLSQILSNLINNALKFTDNGSITFGYTKKKDEIEFFVRDTGQGIKPEMQNIIFKRFRQAKDTENGFAQGSGLGLSISKAFVELHGGKIYVDSEINQGSVFYFTIPYKTPEVTDSDIDNKYEYNNYGSLKGKKVLVAEDDEYSYLYLRELLVKLDIKVLYAKDGAEAVEITDQNPDINLILMDLRMPHMNGLKSARKIKARHNNIPIVIQSAYALTHDKKKIRDENVDDYILKPVQKDELYLMIHKYIKIF